MKKIKEARRDFESRLSDDGGLISTVLRGRSPPSYHDGSVDLARHLTDELPDGQRHPLARTFARGIVCEKNY